jgi:hypothetical protein
MWESSFFGDFQGLWEGWETGQSHRSVFHAFHQAVISTGVFGDLCFVVGPIDLAWALCIAALVAVGPHLRLMLNVLIRLHDCECMTEALILHDCSVAHALVFAENAVGKPMTLPSNLQGPVVEIIELDILSAQLLR